jgi:hypothetical protein
MPYRSVTVSAIDCTIAAGRLIAEHSPLELLAVWHSKYEAWILEQAGIPFRRSQSDVNADGKSVSLGASRPVGAS